MKLKIFLFLIVSLACINGFSQKDPKDDGAKGKKSQKDKDEDEKKLSAKGKAEFDRASAEFKNINNATFDIAANSEVNNVEDRKSLFGINGTPDDKEADKQDAENKKNEKAISDKLQADRKVSGVSHDAGGKGGTKQPSSSTTGVGAAWTDGSFWPTYYATPTKHQCVDLTTGAYRSCGSCWAFAAVAAFEHTYKYFYGGVLNLSEQDVLACGTLICSFIDAGSCGGGWSDWALSWMYCHGLASEASYPYTATNGPCYTKPVSKRVYTWGRVPYPGTSVQNAWIKYYLTIYGAVTTYLKAGAGTFGSYSGGVYNGTPNYGGWGNIDHAVTIVGWYEPYQAWLIKNSWGTGWGFGGYGWIGYNQCNIGYYCYYAYPYA